MYTQWQGWDLVPQESRISFFTIELHAWKYANADMKKFRYKIDISKFSHQFVSWGFHTCLSLVVIGSCNVRNQGKKQAEFISLEFCSKYSGKLKVICSMKKVIEKRPFWTGWICWTELVEVTSSELFGEIRNTRSITWAYYLRQNTINYSRLLRFMKLPVLFWNINFPFVLGNEFSPNQIISDIDLV